jgi:hypothetical protein
MKKSIVVLILGCLTVGAQETPAPESPITGSVDIGYRWNGKVSGNYDAYRSVVNIGEGPRILGVDLTFHNSSHRFVDRIDLRANGWGRDPYSSLRLDATREGAYRLSFDFRDAAYFNALPSFANPSLDRGVLFSQSSFDTRRRLYDVNLDLRPGKRIVPYLAFTHDSGSGRGVVNFVSSMNEYPVSNALRDQTNHFRGGLRFEMSKWHLTLEQGGALFKDDQQVYTSDRNTGNRTTPFLGQNLFLKDLQQAYGVRGRSIYSKGLFTANPVSWMDVQGMFVFSQPRTETNYQQFAGGLIAQTNPVVLVETQRDFIASQVKQPHTSGSFGVEVRPFSRVRIVQSWFTDRFHNASTVQTIQAGDRLALNYNQEQVQGFVDVTDKLSLRGGYRYVWGDAQVRASLFAILPGMQQGELRRHVGLAGLTFRATEKVAVYVDSEISNGDRAYFRTSLLDYEKVRTRVRYSPLSTLVFSGNFLYLNNHNDGANSYFDYRQWQYGASAMWSPAAARRVRLTAEYMRSDLRADSMYILPADRTTERSLYIDKGHVGTAMVDLLLPSVNEVTPKLSFGGSLFRSEGSRATQYYQPVARFAVPVRKHMEWYGEWRWYGFGETIYAFESFRGHQSIFGIRFF